MAKVTDVTPSYYGEPRKFDPNFKGPVHNRHCTDTVCCFIFLSVVLGYITLGTVAAIYGDPKKLVYATDSRGQICGQKGTPTENKHVLFYFDLLKCSAASIVAGHLCPTPQVCVSKCPNRRATLMGVFETDDWNYYKQFCKPHYDLSGKTAKDILKEKGCPSFIMPSKAFFHRCFPNFTLKARTLTIDNQTDIEIDTGQKKTVTDIRKAARDLDRIQHIKRIGEKVFEDYANSWDLIIIGLLVTLVACMVFILLLRYISAILVWVVISCVVASIAYAIFLCFGEYSRLLKLKMDDEEEEEEKYGPKGDWGEYLKYSGTWLFFLVILCLTEGLLLLMLLVLRKRLLISITLMKEASKAINLIISTLFYPLLTFFLLAVCIAFWLTTTVFLASSAKAIYRVTSPDDDCKHDNKTCDPKGYNSSDMYNECPTSECTFVSYGGDTVYYNATSVLHFVNLFVFFWLVNFTIALGQCSLSGAFASYYWALRKPEDLPIHPLLSSFNRALRYHTGSIAMGTLIIFVCQFVRHFLQYFYSKVKGTRNPFGRCLLCSFKCCFWALETFIKYMNRNAYIMLAIFGRNFQHSAHDALFLLMRNVIRVSVLDKVTDFVLFLGKVIICVGIGVLGFFLVSTHVPIIQEEMPAFNYNWVPVATLIVGAYLISHGFFNVYSVCVDTLFLCFLCDIEMNDGSLDKPYYTNINLRKILLQNVNVDSRL